MPSLDNKALLFDLTVHKVDNSIRRTVFQGAANVQATNSEIDERSRTLQPTDDPWTFECLTDNKGTMVRVQGSPVRVTFGLGEATITMLIDSFLLVTSKIDTLQMQPAVDATVAATVRVIQA